MSVLLIFFSFFFFKQKTAYEMRISDWSSDVCSSDLLLAVGGLALLSSGTGSLLIALISLVMLFVVATALHGHLHHLRPAPRHLPLFYLVMSAGGVLGGLFAALMSLLLFAWVFVHPLLFLAAALLLPPPRRLAGARA